MRVVAGIVSGIATSAVPDSLREEFAHRFSSRRNSMSMERHISGQVSKTGPRVA